MKIRSAYREDVPFIVQMIADDELGKLREAYQIQLPERYYEAFENIENDPNQELVVLENKTGVTIGTLQLTFIQYLTYQGGIRAQIEAVRIHKAFRAKGIGQRLFELAIERAKDKGAHVVQLTTDKKRPEA